MGSSSWSSTTYSVRNASLKKAGYDDGMTYDTDLRRSGGPLKVHEKMDPKGVVRESRDSDAHPETVAIAVLFDVTGSMGEVPRVFQQRLNKLMSAILRKGSIEHPAILIGAIGDATCDAVPLQVGQFESGIEMDEDLGRVVLEGGGGGQQTESYELAMYFLARKTSIDCFEKRGKKGYAFIIGDECYYPKVDARQVEHLIGDKLEENISTAAVVAELTAKYETFIIRPMEASYATDAGVITPWKKLFGQHVLNLDDATAVCELIATTIGLCEDDEATVDDVVRDLVASGLDADKAKSATKAVQVFAGSRTPTAKGKSSKKLIKDSTVTVETV